MANIVLAHGILGIGSLPFGIEVPYFNGIAAAYRAKGHSVLVPSVYPLGSLASRSAQLCDAIQQAWPEQTELVVLAHSMGGLDIRHAVANDAVFESPRVSRRLFGLSQVTTAVA